MKRLLSAILPEPVKVRLRPYLDRWTARNLASQSKRVDLCAAQFAHILSLANHPPLANKTCLEIGAGWLLSHAVVCHLLGAKRVLAVDVEPLAHPEYLSTAVHQSISYILQDILSPFESHSLLRKRVDRLFSIKHFDFEVLKELGIEYVSPLDLAKERLGTSIDFVYSNSVLEHVPTQDVLPLLRNVVHDLSPGGTMIHCIHLEDHDDYVHRPFDFLTIPAGAYPRWRETNTGNRIRASGWEKLFGKIGNSQSKSIYSFRRTDVDLPSHIDASIRYRDEMDLRTSHLAIFTKKDAEVCLQSPVESRKCNEDACRSI